MISLESLTEHPPRPDTLSPPPPFNPRNMEVQIVCVGLKLPPQSVAALRLVPSWESRSSEGKCWVLVEGPYPSGQWLNEEDQKGSENQP